MKKLITSIVFVVGVDVLGFPILHKHDFEKWIKYDSKYFKAYSKN